MTDMRRWLDEMGPDYPECHVALVDALRAYIRCTEQFEHNMLAEGSITVEDVRRESAHMNCCRALLTELENWEFDPTLCGFRRTRDLGRRW